MDYLTSFEQKKKIVRQIIKGLAASTGEHAGETIRIMDDLGGHYLLFNNAWKGGKRYYGCFLHIDIHPDGRVWLQHDGTDQKIAEMLMEAGIHREDIVLAFQPPSVRPYSGFAVA